MKDNEISSLIIGCAIRVHTILGPGLLENAYEECLYYELKKSGLFVEKQKEMPLIYDEIKLDLGYKLDLFVEDRIVVELKTVDMFSDIHIAQLLTYLKLTNCKFGLLLNFNVMSMKDGIKRVINKYYIP